MRDLAKVVTVATKGKMFQKDRICVVGFEELGYEAIVPIDINIGDKMVFIQEGAILPEIDRWEFLRKRCYKEELKGFLIKPMTMGARDNNGEQGERVKSWGLCVTLAEAGLKVDVKAGTDVTDELKIRKYEPEEDASPTKSSKVPKWVKFCMGHKFIRWIGNLYFSYKRKNKGNGLFPTDIISKSDETTIQNCPYLLAKFKGVKAYITAKLEGQSYSASLDMKNKRKFYVCSRNSRYNAEDDASSAFWKTAAKYDLAERLEKYYQKTGICLMLQGEQCGPGIQNNIYGFEDNMLFLYRMKGFEGKTWVEYPYPKMKEIADELGVPCVPLLEVVDDMTKYNTIESLVTRAEHAYWKNEDADYQPKANEVLWKNFMQHEGIVVKSENYNKELNKGFSFKVKNMSYQEKSLSEMAKIAQELK